MNWSENLYYLQQAQGGELYTSYYANDLSGILLLPYRGQQVAVCGGYAVNEVELNRAEVSLWTRVLLRAKLNGAYTMAVKSKGLLERSAGKLKNMFQKKEDDFARPDWQPEGYTCSGANEAFTKSVLSSLRLRRLLEQCTEKAPVTLPVELYISPIPDGDGLHLVEVRTDRFPQTWTELWQWGRSNLALTPEENEKESLQMLERLVDVGKAAYDAACDALIL